MFALGSCNQKKMAQKVTEAREAEKQALQQKQLAEQSRRKALLNQKRANEAVAMAERMQRMADRKRQEALLAKKKCEEENIRLQKKIEEIKKKK